MRRPLRFHLLTLLLVVAALCGVITLNTRPHRSKLPSYLLVDNDSLTPGFWAKGNDCSGPHFLDHLIS